MSEVWVMTRFLFVSPRLTALHHKYGAATHWYVRWITSRKSWGFCLFATIRARTRGPLMPRQTGKWGTIMLMRRAAFALRAAITALIVAVSVTGPVAGPLEDAEAAMRRGNYEAAMRVSRTLAEKGDTRFQYLLGAMYQHG